MAGKINHMNSINAYALFYFSIIPAIYLLDIPDRTFHKIIVFLILAIPFWLKATSLLRHGRIRLKKPVYLATLGFLAAVVLSGIIALIMFKEMPQRRIAGILGIILWMITFLSIAASCDRNCLQRALKALTLSILASVGLVLVLDITVDYVPGPATMQLRLGMNSISLGKLLLAGVPGALLMNSSKARYVTLLLISILIFMTGARTIAIALMVTIGVYALLQMDYSHKALRNIFLFVAVGAVIGVIGALLRGVPLSRLTTLHTLYLRFEAWMNTLTIWWRMNPITGTGPGMHRHYLKGPFRLDQLPYSFQAGHAHSEYLAVLADTGIVGLIAWGMLLLTMLMALWKQRYESRFARISLAIFIGYLVASLTEIHFMRMREMTLVIVVMVLGFSAVLYREKYESA